MGPKLGRDRTSPVLRVRRTDALGSLSSRRASVVPRSKNHRLRRLATANVSSAAPDHGRRAKQPAVCTGVLAFTSRWTADPTLGPGSERRIVPQRRQSPSRAQENLSRDLGAASVWALASRIVQISSRLSTERGYRPRSDWIAPSLTVARVQRGPHPRVHTLPVRTSLFRSSVL